MRRIQNLTRRGLGILALAAVLAAPAPRAADPVSLAADAKIDPWLATTLRESGAASFLVRFESSEKLRERLRRAGGSSRRAQAVYDVLRRQARSAQADSRRWLDARSIPYRPLYIINALEVYGDLALARALASRQEVVRLVADPQVLGIEAWPEATPGYPEGEGVPEWGVTEIRAPLVWDENVHGEGITVASADTGVEWDHPALKAHYRGWDGQAASHDFNWHDAIQNLPTPLDDHNHGTHTTGTMVGDDGDLNQIGVAPGARWIACRNMDHGFGLPSTYLECIQFFLAPWPHGGDPEVDGDPSKAPHIVNNSWSCPPSEMCDPLTLQDGFAALEAAGILAVAAAGNSGPSCSSVNNPPGIYDEALVVGAVNSSITLTGFSSRGPVTVDESGRLRPDLAAPGSDVRSSIRDDMYGNSGGTSMASPHVAGEAALLWSARPELRGLIDITRCLITRATRAVAVSSPQTCGVTSETDRPNNLFGWGFADAYEAIHLGPHTDADGIADACDCAPADGGSFDDPREVSGVTFDADRATLRWMSVAGEAGSGTVYDVVRGDLGELLSEGNIAGASCIASALSAAFSMDPDTPALDQGFYYVVQARNACGSGGWGADSAGNSRMNAACP